MKEKELVARKAEPVGRGPFWRSGGDSGLVTYCVTTPGILADEKRREQRRRTRLRAGKILDRRNRFVIDATILDRSCGGLRLRLPRDIDLPDLFHFFDDEAESIFLARIALRNRLIVGVRRGPLVVATPRQTASLRGKFYAMPD